MANWYVSQQNGSDAYDGTTPTVGDGHGPFLTLGAAYTALTAGDQVKVGPGTYRERLSFSKNCGWAGDPECVLFTSDKPGPVRWTAADASERPSTTPAITITTSTIHAISRIIFDGCISTTQGTVDRATFAAACALSNCVVIGYIGARGVALSRSFVFGSLYATYNCRHNAAILIAGQYGAYEPSTSGASNRIQVFARYGVYATGAVAIHNSLAFGCEVGFTGSGSNPTWTNCHAAYCATAFSGGTLTSCLYSACQAGGGATEDDVVLIADYDALRRAFRPVLSLGGLMNMGSTTVVYDFLDLASDAQCSDIGAYILPNDILSWTVGDYYSAAPGIKLQAAGQGRKIIQIAAKAGTLITVKVWNKHDGATAKPTILLRGKSTSPTTTTDTNVSDADVWEQLSVTATPTANEVLELVLYNNEDATYSAWFSDIEVT